MKFKFVKSILILSSIAYGKADDLNIEEIPSNIKTITKTVIYTSRSTPYKPYKGSAFDDVTPCEEGDEECFSRLINECTPEIQYECMASNSIVIQAKCRQLSDVCEDIWYPKATITTTTTTTSKPTSHKPYEGSAFDDVTPCDEGDEECFSRLINECTPEIQYECMASNSIVIQAKCRQLSDVCEDIWYPKVTTTTTTTTTSTKPTSHKPYEGSAFDDVTPCDEGDEECFSRLINECTPEIQYECMASNSIVIQAKCKQLSDVCEDIWYPKSTTTTTTTTSKPTSHKPYEGSAFDDVTPCDEGDEECFSRLINECTQEIQYECMASNSIVIQAKCKQLSDVCEDIWYPKSTTTTTTTTSKPTSHKPYEESAFDDIILCDESDDESDDECFDKLMNECTPEIQHECMTSNSIMIQAKCRQLSEVCEDIWNPRTTTITTTTSTATSLNNDSVTVTTAEKEVPTEAMDMKPCAPKWGQCGGIGYKGPTCCQSGDCHEYNPWYSQFI